MVAESREQSARRRLSDVHGRFWEVDTPLWYAGRPVSDFKVVPGGRVVVLEGRCFQSFESGDRGIVVRVDQQAGSCDVAFDNKAGSPLRVAMRHLGPEPARQKLPEIITLEEPQRRPWTAAEVGLLAETPSPPPARQIAGSPEAEGRSAVKPRSCSASPRYSTSARCSPHHGGSPLEMHRGGEPLAASACPARSCSYAPAVSSRTTTTRNPSGELVPARTQTAVVTAGSAATSEVSSLRNSFHELRQLLAHEIGQRAIAVQKLERDLEELRGELQQHANLRPAKEVGSAECLARMHSGLLELKGRLEEQLARLERELVQKASQVDQRFAQFQGRMEELERAQGQAKALWTTCRAPAGSCSLDDLVLRIDALRKELGGMATKQVVRETLSQELLLVSEAFRRELACRATQSFVRESLQQLQEALSKQCEHRFNELRTQIEATVRKQDAEETLKRLLRDLEGMRELMSRPPPSVPWQGFAPSCAAPPS